MVSWGWAVLEYETDEGWKIALKGNQLALKDLKSLLVHTSDMSMPQSESNRAVPALQCRDAITGLSTWALQLPSCRELFHEQNCVHCINLHSSCCGVDLECSSCIQQPYVQISRPSLLCDPASGNSLRTVDPSTCVLQIQLSQSSILTHTEVVLAVWLFFYNLGVFLVINSTYHNILVKSRELCISISLSLSVLFMFEFYLYIQSWYVLLPFSAIYVIFCLLPVYRIVSYRLTAKTKKEMV